MGGKLIGSCTVLAAIGCSVVAGGMSAGASSKAAGSDCSHPITVTIQSSDLPPEGRPNRPKGPVRVSFVHEPRAHFASFAVVPVTSSLKWRTCEARGTDSAGRHWRMPAPVGPGGGVMRGGPSAVGRLFESEDSQKVRQSIGTVRSSIARIAPTDGRSCASPYTVIRFIETEFTYGDKRYASLKTHSGPPDHSLTVAWAPRAGTVVCEMGAIIAGQMIVRRGGEGGKITFPGGEHCYAPGNCVLGVRVQALWVSVRKPSR
jgi:hypothetical protein